MAGIPSAGPMRDADEAFESFDSLMPFRVQDILLVSSLYDSFILREDGRLNELLIDESLELNLRQIPGITHVSSAAEALDLAKSNPQFNLIVSNLNVGDSSAADASAATAPLERMPRSGLTQRARFLRRWLTTPGKAITEAIMLIAQNAAGYQTVSMK